MRKAQKENYCFRMAMLNAIAETLRENNTECLSFENSTYADENDMVHFTFGGHNCILLSVEKPNLEKGTITMSVNVSDIGELLRLNFDCCHFRCKTLERIACEVYDWLRKEDWEEWDKYEKNIIADTFDTLYGQL